MEARAREHLVGRKVDSGCQQAGVVGELELQEVTVGYALEPGIEKHHQGGAVRECSRTAGLSIAGRPRYRVSYCSDEGEREERFEEQRLERDTDK